MSHSANAAHNPLSASDRAIVNVLIVGAILPLLDTTLVNVALHSIGEQLHAPLSMMQWIVTAYTLAAASTVPLSTWLAQRIGAKQLWLLCLWMFLIGAAMSALARSVELLIFSRIIQGAATGLLLPTMQTIVVIVIGQQKARAALAAMSIPSVLAPIFGPLIGGLALSFTDWRVLFWLHVPICFAAIVLAGRVIPAIERQPSLQFDLTGFVLLCPGLVLAIYGLSGLGDGVSHTTIIFTVAGVLLMVTFARHAYRRRESALVDLTLFAVANFRLSCLLLFLASVVYYGGILLYPLYLIQAGNYTASWAGILLAMHGVGTLIARHKLSVISAKWGDRQTACMAIFLALLGSVILSLPQIIDDTYLLMSGMLFRGAGIGILTIMPMSSAYHGLAKQQVAHASSLTRILTHTGATIGAVMLAMLLHSSQPVAVLSPSAWASAHIALMTVIIVCGLACWRLPARSG
ncbi:DHA2 family efflux MFS transporter permease subunit [Winslowiella iniecta]|uniref:Major facilitator superfamily (MFS) profile domain-containing protein n=1 Tax=Winslowiella iniecta TaxID=1560201 RepID=A0A0L7T492_9GAMM|nr:DHA2 family efflux MFS transporter permease subunit [Winslowiella iniecta]KOC87861.1 hypothetical protein NG42_18840 [Winslowiella iniecta]KOC90229.1 hypothetical protein NG43_17640 [Winslowiella iniecta]